MRYIIISSYISEMIATDHVAKKALQKAKEAFQFLLPYGLNLYKYPMQKEYRRIKVQC